MSDTQPISINVDEFINDLPHLYTDATYWLVRANGGQYFTDFNINNYVGINYNEVSLKSIQEAETLAKIKNLVIATYPQFNEDDGSFVQLDFLEDEPTTEPDDALDAKTKKNPGSIAGQLQRFALNIRKNDIVVVPGNSATTFIVGQVESDPYELTAEDISKLNSEPRGYETSDFRKRIKVKWLGRFNRSDADSNLYPMIYSQHTVTIINDYSRYINRALFDAYLLDDQELHLTFHITQESNVDAKALGQFIYEYSKLFEEVARFTPGTKLDIANPDNLIIRVNVQSKGPAETIAASAFAGGVALLLLTFSITGGNFNLSVAGNTIHASSQGVMKAWDEHQSDKIELEEKTEELKDKKADEQIARIKKAKATAEELKVPVSSLGIDLPRQTERALQKQIDRETEKKESSTNTNASAGDSQNQ